jgi:hypothetical protein
MEIAQVVLKAIKELENLGMVVECIEFKVHPPIDAGGPADEHLFFRPELLVEFAEDFTGKSSDDWGKELPGQKVDIVSSEERDDDNFNQSDLIEIPAFLNGKATTITVEKPVAKTGFLYCEVDGEDAGRIVFDVKGNTLNLSFNQTVFSAGGNNPQKIHPKLKFIEETIRKEWIKNKVKANNDNANIDAPITMDNSWKYMMEFEEGTLSEDKVIELFQFLVDTGLAWSLQGFYGRTAQGLIEEGLITPKNTQSIKENENGDKD